MPAYFLRVSLQIRWVNWVEITRQVNWVEITRQCQTREQVTKVIPWQLVTETISNAKGKTFAWNCTDFLVFQIFSGRQDRWSLTKLLFQATINLNMKVPSNWIGSPATRLQVCGSASSILSELLSICSVSWTSSVRIKRGWANNSGMPPFTHTDMICPKQHYLWDSFPVWSVFFCAFSPFSLQKWRKYRWMKATT